MIISKIHNPLNMPILRNLLAASILFQSCIYLEAYGQAFPEAATQQLKVFADDQRIRDQQNYSLALNLAAQKNWPQKIEGRNGVMARLVGVDANGFPVYFETMSNVAAAATIGTKNLWIGGSSGLNLSGNSELLKNRLAIWDGGAINGSHQELVGRITPKDDQPSEDGHSTHVAGTIMASGVNAIAKGMANRLPGILSYTFQGHTSEMASEAASLLASNHSYGAIAGWRYNNSESRWEFWGSWGENEDFKFGFYNQETQTWDSLAYLAPNYLIVKSAGNNRNESGPAVGTNYWRFNSSGTMVSAGARPEGMSSQTGFDLLSTYATAKNSLTIGNVLPIPLGYSKPADVVLNNSSSTGPTDDGRIKPDVVANGTSVISSYSGSPSAYANLTGTSMSTPTISGSVMLLQELYMRKNDNAAAWSSTMRGLVIHTAMEATGVPGPDYLHGWGLANIEKAALMIDNKKENLVEQKTLNNGAKYAFNVIASGKGPLKVTLCWTDPPGTVLAGTPINDRSKKLIHDLDLRVKRGNQTYLPWKLDGLMPSLPASRGDNDVDNVEVIEIDSTIVGETYTIEVTHKGTLTRTGTQNYSLIASGVGGKAYSASAANSSAGSRIDSLSLGGISLQNPAGCKTYSDFRLYAGSLEVGGSVPYYIKTNSCDASDAVRFVRIFFDFNNDGDFTDMGESIATSDALKNNAAFSGFMSIPNTLKPGDYIVMRVVLMETESANDISSINSYERGETQDYQFIIAKPSNDFSAGLVQYPASGECANPAKYITVSIRNTGSVAKSRIPVEVEIRNGNTTVATITDTCKLNINGQAEAAYTLQKPFAMEAGKTYTIYTRVKLAGDQLPGNNELITEVSTAKEGAVPTNISAVLCNGSEVLMKANAASAESRLLWYASPTSMSPFANSGSGSVVSTSTITPDKKYFVAADDFAGKVGPSDKIAFTSGGYNEFSGNFVRFSNTVPMLIESVRMYTANPGSINIIFADLANEPNAQGSYSYYNRQSTIIPVTNSRPIAQGGSLTENNPNDKGFVYNLNFAVLEPGNHILIMQCQDGANVYRNNNIPLPGPYPLKLNGSSDAFTITGNGVQAPSDPNNFYYFFYDMKVSPLNACPSPRVPFTAPDNIIPTVTQNGNLLTSSSIANNQWRLNNADIEGASNQQYTANVSGLYRVAVTDALGCVSLSNELNVVVTSINIVDAEKIGMNVSPNPNQGKFNLQFRVTGRDDLNVAILNVSGQQVYQKSYPRFGGSFNETIQLEGATPGVYLLRINHGEDYYVRRILIQ